jgi:NAD(P)-dependent dehydrogenase (short-subunit alcohol dehydrogenase family)
MRFFIFFLCGKRRLKEEIGTRKIARDRIRPPQPQNQRGVSWPNSHTDDGPGAAAPSRARGENARSEPLKRLGEPEEIGEAVAWLCSERASYVTGLPMPVDGGFMAQ